MGCGLNRRVSGLLTRLSPYEMDLDRPKESPIQISSAVDNVNGRRIAI
jgi:hypothetical protein